ncbi:MAG: hypothetical protein H7839_18730 [Magnetococcus sp. YQC-5]
MAIMATPKIRLIKATSASCGNWWYDWKTLYLRLGPTQDNVCIPLAQLRTLENLTNMLVHLGCKPFDRQLQEFVLLLNACCKNFLEKDLRTAYRVVPCSASSPPKPINWEAAILRGDPDA